MDISRFDGISVRDTDGHEVALTTLLLDRVTVVVFLRHFG